MLLWTLLQRPLRPQLWHFATILSYRTPSSLLTVFTRRLGVCVALYQSRNTNYTVRKGKGKVNPHLPPCWTPQTPFPPLRLTSITCLSEAWHLEKGYSRQWNMADRELGGAGGDVFLDVQGPLERWYKISRVHTGILAFLCSRRCKEAVTQQFTYKNPGAPATWKYVNIFKISFHLFSIFYPKSKQCKSAIRDIEPCAPTCYSIY